MTDGEEAAWSCPQGLLQMGPLTQSPLSHSSPAGKEGASWDNTFLLFLSTYGPPDSPGQKQPAESHLPTPPTPASCFSYFVCLGRLLLAREGRVYFSGSILTPLSCESCWKHTSARNPQSPGTSIPCFIQLWMVSILPRSAHWVGEYVLAKEAWNRWSFSTAESHWWPVFINS